MSEEKSSAKLMLNNYLVKDVVVDFNLPRDAKLSILQKTPKQYIKERKLGNQMVKYVEHKYARKALNFVFNFDYSSEVISKEYLEYIEDYFQKQKDDTFKKAQRKVIEAECEVLFTFPNGLKKTVFGSHKGYPNPATTRGDIMKSALSQAHTKVAQTFGMATEEEYVPIGDTPIEEETIVRDVTPSAPITKSFNPKY